MSTQNYADNTTLHIMVVCVIFITLKTVLKTCTMTDVTAKCPHGRISVAVM